MNKNIKKPVKALIELPTWLGDCVMSTPAIENIINYYSDIEITIIGPYSSIEIIKNHRDDALEKGAKLLTGNDWDGVSDLIPPMVFENVDKSMLVVNEETFGPVVALMKFDTEQEAIA